MSRSTVKITFICNDDANNSTSEATVNADLNMSVLEVAKQNDIDLEGACECSCACSTCHVILS